MDYKFPTKWPLWQGVLSLMILMAGCQSASADLKCTFDSNSLILDIGVNTAPIVVTPGTPVGTTLYQDKVAFTARCSLNKIVGQTEYAYFKRHDLKNLLGNGLGLYITFKGDRGNTTKLINTGIEVVDRSAFLGLPSSNWQEIPLEVEIEIVKEKHAGETIVVASPLVKVLSVDSMAASYSPADFYIRGADKMTFKTQTCDIEGPRSFSVEMGTVSPAGTQGFGSGIGSTSAGKNYSLNLQCELSTSGAFSVMMQLDGTAVSGFASAGVLALKTGATSATGAGLQILQGDSQTPVSFAKPWQIGRFPLAEATLSVPFTARYYQTEYTIRPGIANSTVTYTISYL